MSPHKKIEIVKNMIARHYISANNKVLKHNLDKYTVKDDDKFMDNLFKLGKNRSIITDTLMFGGDSKVKKDGKALLLGFLLVYIYSAFAKYDPSTAKSKREKDSSNISKELITDDKNIINTFINNIYDNAHNNNTADKILSIASTLGKSIIEIKEEIKKILEDEIITLNEKVATAIERGLEITSVKATIEVAKKLGIKTFQWVYGEAIRYEPRLYHKNVLDGGIYSLENPPIINQKTGRVGYPTEEYYCKCQMKLLS